MLLKIDQEFKELIPAQQEEEHKSLDESIRKNGFDPAYPLIVWDGILIDGHNRYELCLKNGVEFNTIEKTFSNREEAYNWIIENQLSRRNITKEQKLFLIGKRYTNEKKTEGAPIGNSNQLGKNYPVVEKRTSEKIAEQNKVSEKTVRNAANFSKAVEEVSKNSGVASQEILSRTIKASQKDIQTLAQANPEKQKEVVNRVKEHKAASIKQAMQQVKEEEMKSKPALPTNTKYNVIYADPPWNIGSFVLDKWDSPLEDKYPTMSLDELKRLDLYSLKDQNCVLFMWSTLTTIPDALELMKAWGFKYHIMLTWDKGNGWSSTGFHRKTEVILVGYVGKITEVINQFGNYIPTVFYEAKKEHSQKPEIMYNYLISNTKGKRLEMFAREKKEGFDVWGNEV